MGLTFGKASNCLPNAEFEGKKLSCRSGFAHASFWSKLMMEREQSQTSLSRRMGTCTELLMPVGWTSHSAPAPALCGASTSQMCRTRCPGTKHLYRTSPGANPTHSGKLWWGECILGVVLSIYPGCSSKNLLGHCFKQEGSRSWLSVIIHCQNQYGWQACFTDIYDQRAHFPGMCCQSHCPGPVSTPVITFLPT